MGIGWTFSQSAAAEYGLWVSTSEGKRFVNELANRKIRADAILAEQANGFKRRRHLHGTQPGRLQDGCVPGIA